LNLAAIRLAQIRHKLEWSAEGEWSAHLTPQECELLLKHLTKPKESNGRVRECRTGQRCSDVP